MELRPVRLTLLQPALAPQKIDAEGPLITLGRATDCTIPIKDRYLSRRHAEIAFSEGAWIVRDLGSVNGTLLNGTKVNGTLPLRSGDRIMLGDSEVVFEPEEVESLSKVISLDSDSHSRISIPLRLAVEDTTRSNILSLLALQFIEERSMHELFDFILDQVMGLLTPSRTAIALLAADGISFDNVLLRRSTSDDSLDLYISQTLLKEVIDERKVISFVDTSQDGKLARAESIIAQNIRSAVCAPLIVSDRVLGVLYLDFLANRGAITHEDVQLVAQVARLAAVKLETTRLREESIAKAKLDEELKTAYVIQSRLLPTKLPEVPGYTFAGTNKPCRTVSGDYYDVVLRPDGRVYFIVADVSGKGVTAALVMASVATAFNIFTRTDPSPADLVRELNLTLAPKTAPTKFVTLVAGLLDPATGMVQFANAGHVSPLVVRERGVEQQTTTDMVAGLFAHATYRNQSIQLDAGDSIVLFTDGVTEAENDDEEQLGLEPIADALASMHGVRGSEILAKIEERVHEFCGNAPAADDVTMFALTRLQAE
jgi:serine phosphatase RsbU (regulator of sigma subunit)